MWCVNPMVADTWKAEPYPGYPSRIDSAEADECEDKVDDQIAPHPSRHAAASLLTRSASCNRIKPANPNRKAKRSLSTSGAQCSRPIIKHRPPTPENDPGADDLDNDPPPKEKDKLKRSNSVLTRLARQYSFTRLRRTSSSSSKDNNMSAALNQDETSAAAVAKGRTPRRRRNKSAFKKDPKTRGQFPLPPLRMTVGNPHINGELTSSPDSCPSSPPYFKPSFSISPPAPTDENNAARATSPISADELPLPSSPSDDKSYDSGRMSMSSFRSFGSGRPTSMSSVTSSLSSRTSRGSDYFSSASSTGQADQVTSYRLGLQTVLPELDEADSVDRLVLDDDRDDDASKKPEDSSSVQSKEMAKRNSRTAAFKQNSNLNEVDHLAPVSNLAMLANPDLSYVDRVILELLETERMYVRSLRDILTGYLAVIRRTPQLNIQPNDVDDLFGNIRDIYDFNRNLLGELEECCGDPRGVSKCFVSKDEDFKVYTEYCTNYPSSVAAMRRCMQNPNLVDFFKVQQEDLRHTLPLGSYLLKPVQRILKYHLLLQELVKHCDKTEEGYQTIQNALQTMTKVARHINEMKRKHEDAVHIQEIQSLLTNWQGNELTTYGELILDSEMKMQGAKNERQVFLFEKMILITKRREDGFLVCKASITCANLVLLESLPNTPLGFQIQPFTENATCISGGGEQPANNVGTTPDPNRVQRYVLLAPSQEEKSQWTYHIKRLIIETMCATVPLKAKKSIMRMRPVRDGDGDGDSEEDRMRKKSKSRFSSSAILSNQDGKTTKSPLARLASATSSANMLSGGGQTSKSRRRSDSMSRKGLHKRVLQKRKDQVESGDVATADYVSNGQKLVGKFSFTSLKQSARSGGVQPSSKPATGQAQAKSPPSKSTNADLKAASQNEKDNTKRSHSNQNGEVVKRHHNSVIYRRHKRRTSQPITVTEKRLSMKLGDDENEKENDGDVTNDDDLMNFNPLTARESVSWDIQIVEAVFERYKQEGASSGSPPACEAAPTPALGKRRKSRLLLVPPDSSSEEDAAKKVTSGPPSGVVRRRKSKAGLSHRTSGVVYALSQDLDVESDSGLCEKRAILRKVVQASEDARKSLVIHESDAEADTNLILMERANALRRGTPRKNAESAPADPPVEFDSNRKGSRRGSLYDNLDNVARSDVITSRDVITSSVQCMSTQTISVVDSSTGSASEMVTVQSSSIASITSTFSNDVISTNSNNNNNNNKQLTVQNATNSPITKDTTHIPAGTVRGLIERMWNSPHAKPSSSSTRQTSLKSPTRTGSHNKSAFEPKSPTGTVPPNCVSRPKDLSVIRDRSAAPNRAVEAKNLPLAISSGGECDGKEKVLTVEQNVQRSSTHESLSAAVPVEGTRSSNSVSFIRRTFSQDDSKGCTRRGTNLRSEATGKTQNGYVKSFSMDDRPRDITQSPMEQEGFKFESTEENVAVTKDYLFEKLCLEPTGLSKVTDEMSEEFEHVCSNLENSLRVSSVDSYAFSIASEEEGIVTPKMQKKLRKNMPAKKAVVDTSRKECVFGKNKLIPHNPTMVLRSDAAVETSVESVSGSQSYGRQYGRSDLPRRSDSICSTRSEFTSSRVPSSCAAKDSDARGRSAAQRNRNSSSHARIPSKDLQAIPRRNVARLTKQFSEIENESDKLAVASPPRRSRSVGGAARAKQRLQIRQIEREAKLDKKPTLANSAAPFTSAEDDSARRGRSETPRGGAGRRIDFRKAEVTVDEICVCEAVDDLSSKLLTEETLPLVRELSSPIEDDVFSPPEKVHSAPAKKMSLIEMFATNPHKTSEPQKDNAVVPNEEKDDRCANSHPDSGEKSIEVSLPSVRVVLVPRSDGTEGRGGLEPRVYNLTPSKEAHSPPPFEKQKSWTKLSSGNAEAPRRTRLRSSSLVRAGRCVKSASDS